MRSVCQVLYKHEGQTALKVLDKAKTSVSLPLPKDNGYVVLEIRSWGEGGDGPAHEIIVSRDSGEKPRNTRQRPLAPTQRVCLSWLMYQHHVEESMCF